MNNSQPETSLDKWTKIIEEVESNDFSIRAYCRSNGVMNAITINGEKRSEILIMLLRVL